MTQCCVAVQNFSNTSAYSPVGAATAKCIRIVSRVAGVEEQAFTELLRSVKRHTGDRALISAMAAPGGKRGNNHGVEDMDLSQVDGPAYPAKGKGIGKGKESKGKGK